MAVSQIVSIIFNLDLLIVRYRNVSEHLNPQAFTNSKRMTMLHCHENLVLEGYEKLGCVKIDFLVHSYPN